MHAKGFPSFLVPVMIIASSGCDNVEFGGFQLELQAPAPAQGMPTQIVLPDSLPTPLAPIQTGPVLYLVERSEGSEASLVAVASFTDEGYEPLPDVEEVPEMVERFAIGRFEPATEFVLLSRGARAGTFIADGFATADETTCRLRPSASGRVEIRPEASGERRFLAVAKDDLFAVGLESAAESVPIPGSPGMATLGPGSVTAAQIAMPAMNIPWPASIPGARQDLQPLVFDGGATQGLAASFVYGGEMDIGPEVPVAYGLFIASAPVGTRYEPIVAWYQRVGQDGKAFAQLLGAHDLQQAGAPDLLLEVFGEEARWFALLGTREGDWSMLYQDPCGVPAARGGIRTFR
jgi:hypothetical protein